MALSAPTARTSAKTVDGGYQGAVALVTGLFTPSSNALLVAIGTVQKDGQVGTDRSPDMTILDSAGLTWSSRALAGSTADFGMATRVWTAPVTTGVAMTVTLGCGANLTIAKLVSVFDYTGYDLASPVGATAASAALGVNGAQSLTLSGATAATSSVCGGMGAALTATGTTSVTQGSGYTEIHDICTTDDAVLETQARPTGSTSTAFDWVDVDAGAVALYDAVVAVAIEIKEASAAPNPVGSRRVHPRPLRKVFHGMYPKK